MDLISRKAAIEEFEDMVTSVSVYGESAEARYATNARIRFIEKLNSIPTVDAVPLDKLCSMLAKYIGFPCNYSPIDEEMADYCGDQCEMDDIGCWGKVLSKWMEEQQNG